MNSMSVGFAADLPDRDFKRDSWPKTDIPPSFRFLSAVHLTLCIPSSTFWQVDMPVNRRDKFPAAMPHQQKKTKKTPNTDLLLCLERSMQKEEGCWSCWLRRRSGCSVRQLWWGAGSQGGRRRRRGKVTAGAVVHIRSIKFMAKVALNTGHAQNAGSVIYPGVPRRREMFMRYHRFSSIVIRELEPMSCPRHLSLCRATRWH